MARMKPTTTMLLMAGLSFRRLNLRPTRRNGAPIAKSCWTHVTIIREVAVRFVFTAIGYKGRYISHVGGYHDAVFPTRREICRGNVVTLKPRQPCKTFSAAGTS